MNSLTITLALCLGLVASLAAQDPQDASAPPATEVETIGEETLARAHRAAAADVELAELTQMIRAAPTADGWPHASMGLRKSPATAAGTAEMHPVIQASARLVLFETRFGVRAESRPGWAEFRDASSAALTLFAVRTVDQPHSSPAQMWVRAFLEFASGDADAARTTLLGDHPRISGGDCEYHLAENMYWLAAGRAVVLDLIGDTATALPWYHAACYWYWADLFGALTLGYHRIACDLVLARYAEHLVALDAADGAARVLQALDRHWPDSLGTSIAERALRPKLPRITLSTARLFALQDHRTGEWSDRTGLLFLLGDPSDPAAARVLAGTVAYEAPAGATLINPLWDVDSVASDDPRLAPLLRRFRTHRLNFWDRGHLTQPVD